MKEISSHQFILLSVFLLLSTKLLTIQPLVYEMSGKDSFFSIALGKFVDFLLLVLVVILLKKHKDETFFELLKNTFGTFFAKILLVIFSCFIFLKLVFLSEETYSFFIHFMYDDLNLFVYIIPFMFVTGYFAIKGITSIVRTMEIFAIFVLIGIIVCSLTAVDGINFNHILPLFEDGIGPMINGLKPQIFYRGNALILLMFMGKIKFDQNFNLRFYLTNAVMFLLVLGMVFIFYLVYGPSVKYVSFTLAEIPQFDPFVSDLGRFNWLSVVICTIALILTNSAMLYCLALIFRWVFGFKRSIVPTFLSLTILVVLAILNDFSLSLMEQKIVGLWMYINGSISILFLILTIILLTKRSENGQKLKA